jgi:hypothetical protein
MRRTLETASIVVRPHRLDPQSADGLRDPPDGGDAWAPAKPRPYEMLIRALARAHRWKRKIAIGHKLDGSPR